MKLCKEFKKELRELRRFEANFICKYGSIKRIYKMVGVDMEIKFEKAKMLFRKSLAEDQRKRQMQMLYMMYRAYGSLEDCIKANGYSELEPQIRCYDYDKGKYALVCDYDDEKPSMIKNYNLDADAVFFSMQELFRIIPTDLMQIKESLTKSFGDANFEKVRLVK
tara:strand:- start:2374 stop:2868 length:495 start_codon:yes stop_codon:yes gene_type:complete